MVEMHKEELEHGKKRVTKKRQIINPVYRTADLSLLFGIAK